MCWWMWAPSCQALELSYAAPSWLPFVAFASALSLKIQASRHVQLQKLRYISFLSFSFHVHFILISFSSFPFYCLFRT